MASWGVLMGLCGFEYHGPNGHIGFAPRITPEDFRAVFTAAEGWGTLAQKRESGKQTARLEVKWGKLPVKTLALELPEGAKLQEVSITASGRPIDAEASQEERRLTLTLSEAVVLEESQAIDVTLTFS